MHEDARDPLNLSRLPSPEPPGDAWPAIAAGMRQRRRRRIGAWAVAATVALSAGLGWQLSRAPGSGEPPRMVAGPGTAVATGTQATQETASVPRPPNDGPPAAAGSEALAALIGLSQQLENRLRVLRSETGPMPADSLVYQVELEDLVAQVDDALSRRPDSQVLWSQRVNLLLDLNQLYAQELRREPARIASL